MVGSDNISNDDLKTKTIRCNFEQQSEKFWEVIEREITLDPDFKVSWFIFTRRTKTKFYLENPDCGKLTCFWSELSIWKLNLYVFIIKYS